LNNKNKGTTILPVLCISVKFFVTQREEGRLKLFKSKVLRKIFVLLRDEMLAG